MKAMMLLDEQVHIFGSDENQSGYLVEGDSVEGQHATIRRKEDGDFEIADLGGDAGTWVNYAPVSAEGASLRNGDLVHIGRAAFRFFLERPKGRAFRERRR